MPSSTPSEILTPLIATTDLPELGPRPRPSRRSISELQPALDAALGEGSISSLARSALCSAVLLWHDHLEASHEISQTIHTADGSFLHGIMHRREPDYGNAKYWFHRVGKHVCYPEIARRAGALLDQHHQEDLARALTGKGWDAFAFVDLCEEASTGRPAERVQLLREIQAIEFQVLFEHLCRAAQSGA